MTDSSQSTTPRNRPSSYQEKRISIGSFGSGDGVAAGPGLPDDAVHSGTSSTSSAVSYQPPSSLWPCTPNGKREPQFRQSIIGDENKCRRKFAKMVQAAQQFQSEHKAAHDIPKEMEIVFNGQDNVQYIRLVLNGQSEYHKFCGNSQYIPPELMTTGTYNSNGLADVWVLGISLYRMLVGKFPFIASSDRKLFKKMLHADFSIPHSLSEDAQDLLRRMLAPESSRASLDLVMFHPWLKSYMATTTMVSDLQRPNQRLQKEQPQKQSNATDVDNHATIPSSSSGFVPETSLLSPPSSPPPPPRPTAAAAAEHDTLANAPRKPSTRDRSSKRMSRTLADMLLILVEGPFPPPKHPYRELAYLGADRREEIAAAL
ncbi:kinase-like domain-containing protein [Syncephalastrum racemosum]|uniref:Kinase-like domain-containing protein n=1 Tax=Syncephalastrum racemosum TaxID=13706 RepID=A0A1X2HFL7_SYNRA|nr:kinase-like domain-containing protein [Syncephalastrum racemosum]